MKASTLRAKQKTFKIGKEPMVIVPMSLWRKIESLIEDQEALTSHGYLRRVEKSRADLKAGKVIYPFK